MNYKTDYQLGDTVVFTEEFYNDPYAYVPTYESYAAIETIYQKMSSRKFKTALYRVQSVVVGFWDEGVWLDYKLFDIPLHTNHFYFEVQATGERRIFNDPSRYEMNLLEWGFQRQLANGLGILS